MKRVFNGLNSFLAVTKLVLVTLIVTSCGGSNYFAAMSNKTSDEAIFEEVLKDVDLKSYDSALTKFGTLTTGFKNQYLPQRTLSGIYAGKCGLDLILFSQGLSGGSGAPFSSFMSGFTTATVAPTQCQTSQSTIEGAFGSTSAARVTSLGSTTGNELNTFMAFLGMAKIGTQLRGKADADKDGTVGGGFDACLSASISDNEIIQVGTGLALLLTNFSTIAATYGGNASAINNLNAACALITPNPCTVTDPTDSTWTDPLVLMAIRALIKSQSIGIQSCNNSDPFTCCP